MKILNFLAPYIGILVILGGCWFFSKNKALINWRTVISGLLIQVIFALCMLKLEFTRKFFSLVSEQVIKLINFSQAGAKFAFGDLYSHEKFVFAFEIMASLIFMFAFVALLDYLGVLHPVLKAIAFVFQKIMGISGIEVLVNSGSALLGQVSSALPVHAYLKNLSDSQLFSIMLGGMSTMSVAVIAVYVNFGIPSQYILAANLMGIPAGLIIAKMLYPSEKQENSQTLPEAQKSQAFNIIDAIVRGAQDGIKISSVIIAVVIAIISLTALLDSVLGVFSLSLSKIFAVIFYPVVWLVGTPVEEIPQVAQFFGSKLALNECIGFIELAKNINSSSPVSEKSIMTACFLVSGFANFGSVALQIGAFSGLVPEKKHVFAKLGLQAMLGATIASCLSACWANIFY